MQRDSASAFALLATAVIVAYETFVVVKSFNVPILDDFDAILVPFGHWREDPSIALLFERFNEHWIAFTKLATVAVVALNGEVNFRLLQVFAALALLPIAGLVVWQGRTSPLWPIAAAGVCVFLFRLYDVKFSFYAMAAIQSLWGMAFAAAYLFFALRTGLLALALSLAFLILSLATNSNAIIAAPIAIVFLMLRGRHAAGAVHAVIASPPTLLFILTSTGDTASMLGGLIADPILFLEFTIGLVGGSFVSASFGQASVAWVAGAVLCIGVMWYLLAARDPEDDFAKPLLVFCAATCALISLGRSQLYADAMPGVFGDGRYVIYSAIIVAVLFQRLVIRASIVEMWHGVAVSLIATILVFTWVASYALQFAHMTLVAEDRSLRLERWAAGLMPDIDPPAPDHSDILREAICSGYYRADLASLLCQAAMSVDNGAGNEDNF